MVIGPLSTIRHLADRRSGGMLPQTENGRCFVPVLMDRNEACDKPEHLMVVARESGAFTPDVHIQPAADIGWRHLFAARRAAHADAMIHLQAVCVANLRGRGALREFQSLRTRVRGEFPLPFAFRRRDTRGKICCQGKARGWIARSRASPARTVH